ncbi:MAG: hypothetical protein ACYTFY_23160 [Planctomycetota bacterium]|jgi:hypothetical protein
MTTKDKFNLWVFGDVHVGTDLKHGRESLTEVIQTSEEGGDKGGPAFDWDLAIDVGDMSGGQSVPENEEGEEIVRQFGALKKHKREDIYNISGNHDRSGLDEESAWWWKKWLDPMGENTEFSKVDNSKRPYKIDGTWERYSFQVGNMLFLMMSDINEPSQTVGRGDLGGNPAGVVSGETFEWWKDMVSENKDSIIISAHHYMLKETTVASGDWEGMRKDENGDWVWHYHGLKPEGAPIGASYLYFVDSKPDSGAFENFLDKNQGAVDIWRGGHTHTHPDDTYGDKTHIEKKWGTNFINAACVSRWHGKTNVPKSRLLNFENGSNKVKVGCYMHTDEFLPQGWYDKAEQVIELSKPFEI